MNLFLILFSISFYSYADSLDQVNITTTNPPLTTAPLTVAPLIKQVVKNSTFVNQTKTVGSTLQDRIQPDPIRNVSLFSFFNKITGIGDPCNSTDDCKPVDSICTGTLYTNGTCQCKPEFVASTNRRSCLIKAKNLQDVCTEDIQCDSIPFTSGLAVCVSFSCVCGPNAELIEDNCYKKAVLGKTCKGDVECSSIPFSYCFQGVCACDPDFSPNLEGTQCYPLNGTTNMTNINCSVSSLVCKVFGEHSYCSNSTCACFPGYIFSTSGKSVSGECIVEKKLDEDCTVDSDCAVDMQPKEPLGVRVCENNKCTCMKGYKPSLEHNTCESGSAIIKHSLLLLMACLLFLYK